MKGKVKVLDRKIYFTDLNMTKLIDKEDLINYRADEIIQIDNRLRVDELESIMQSLIATYNYSECKDIVRVIRDKASDLRKFTKIYNKGLIGNPHTIECEVKYEEYQL